MKARYGVPLLLGVAILTATTVMYPTMRMQAAAASDLRQSYGPHNPDDYRFPMCHSMTYTGWGIYRDATFATYVVQPGREPRRIVGHWSQYPKLANLYCAETYPARS